jgi:hypothetical protein
VADQKWRGVGMIPNSGLRLRDEYAAYDAERLFDLELFSAEEPAECSATSEGGPGTITCASVNAKAHRSSFSHQLTPQSLLAFCERLYSGRPQAFVVSIAGHSFDAAETLSNEARSAFPQLVSTVHQLVNRLAQPGSD